MVGEVERAGAFPPILGNALALLTEGPAAFSAVRDAIRQASRYIHLVTYIFKNDPTGRGTLKLLADAARRGVEVRVLYDGAGTFATRFGFFAPIREAGGTVASFLPISPFIPGWRLNLRNHRKLIIVDGEVAFTGGMNIGDEYATGFEWRDVHVQLRGPVLPALQRVFSEDWHLATGKTLDDEKYFQELPEAGEVPIQVVPSGPDQIEPLAPELLFGAIAAARETVDIMTPYLIPPEPIEQALRSAARRGRRVRILIPEYVDHRVVRWAADSYLPRLLRAGVEIWRHPHMVHGKLVIVDNAWATLGSTNLDMRSLFLNFELNVAIPHTATATMLAAYFEGELVSSQRLTFDDMKARFPTRLARAAANLLSPLL
jgi:cardiolipin synthase